MNFDIGNVAIPVSSGSITDLFVQKSKGAQILHTCLEERFGSISKATKDLYYSSFTDSNFRVEKVRRNKYKSLLALEIDPNLSSRHV